MRPHAFDEDVLHGYMIKHVLYIANWSFRPYESMGGALRSGFIVQLDQLALTDDFLPPLSTFDSWLEHLNDLFILDFLILTTRAHLRPFVSYDNWRLILSTDGLTLSQGNR